MADADKSIYGRKVFFINPSMNFESSVIDRLRLMEYEVYSIDDYRKAKPLLRKNSDSICFCIIESQLSLKGWHNFIKSFETENIFKPLDMGVIMPTLPEEKKANFIAGLQLDAGVLMQNQDQETLFHEIVKSMDAMNAKGMRKYVRANCLNEPQADLLWLVQAQDYRYQCRRYRSKVVNWSGKRRIHQSGYRRCNAQSQKHTGWS